MLNGEWVNTSIMAPDFQPPVGETHSPDKVNIWQESLNLDEVAVLVSML